jgi:hypothetical protein
MMLNQWLVLAIYTVASYCLFYVTLMIYRYFFHPLSHIPGPLLAKTTFLYEWYYDLYLRGQYTFHLKSLHQAYGQSMKQLN